MDQSSVSKFPPEEIILKKSDCEIFDITLDKFLGFGKDDVNPNNGRNELEIDHYQLFPESPEILVEYSLYPL